MEQVTNTKKVLEICKGIWESSKIQEINEFTYMNYFKNLLKFMNFQSWIFWKIFKNHWIYLHEYFRCRLHHMKIHETTFMKDFQFFLSDHKYQWILSCGGVRGGGVSEDIKNNYAFKILSVRKRFHIVNHQFVGK